MNLSDKQLTAFIQLNKLTLDTLIAVEAKMTALLNTNAVMMAGFSKGALKHEEISRMQEETFQKELRRLRESHQKAIDHFVSEMRED